MTKTITPVEIFIFPFIYDFFGSPISKLRKVQENFDLNSLKP